MSIPTNAPRMYLIWCMANPCVNSCTLSIIPSQDSRFPQVLPTFHLTCSGTFKSQPARIISDTTTSRTSVTRVSSGLAQYNSVQLSTVQRILCMIHSNNITVRPLSSQFLKRNWTIRNNLPETPANSFSKHPIKDNSGNLSISTKLYSTNVAKLLQLPPWVHHGSATTTGPPNDIDHQTNGFEALSNLVAETCTAYYIPLKLVQVKASLLYWLRSAHPSPWPTANLLFYSPSPWAKVQGWTLETASKRI